MRKFKLFLILMLSVMIIISLALIPGCAQKATTQETIAETTQETVVETTQETVVETAGSGVEKEEITLDMLVEYAKTEKPWPGKPGEGKKLAYAVNFAGNPFGDRVTDDIRKQAELAGIDVKNDFFYLDNKADSVVALENADILLAKNPDCFIQFQLDAKANAVIAMKFAAAGIPMVAVDIPVPGAPFVGVNNWGVATWAGKETIKLIEERWGGWDAVDVVLMIQLPVGGEICMLRSEGFAQTLVDKYGPDAEKKIVRVDGGTGDTLDAQKASIEVISKYPDAKKWVVTGIDEEAIAGFQAAMELEGRWNKDNVITIGQGLDALGRQLVREGITDGSIAYFPEKYGQYLVPVAIAQMLGLKVPASTYVFNEFITKDNIDEFYPAE